MRAGSALPSLAALRHERWLTAAWGRQPVRIRIGLSLVALLVLLVLVERLFLAGQLESSLEAELQQRAESAALATAGLLESGIPLASPELVDGMMAAALDPAIRSITIFQDTGPALVPVASTFGQVPETVRGVSHDAHVQDRFVDAPVSNGIHAVALPVPTPQARHVVTVTYSQLALESLRDLHYPFFVTLAFVTIGLIAVAMDLVANRLVYQPVTQLAQAMQRVADGDTSVRLAAGKHDDIGRIQAGFNRMLNQLESARQTLEERVEAATAEIRTQDAELVDRQSELLLVRERLARSERLAALGRLSAKISHQIGTPLNLISGQAQLLIQEVGSDFPHVERLHSIRTQAAKLAHAVRAMLDSVRVPLNKQPIDVRTVIASVDELARPLVPASVRLDCLIPAEPALVAADQPRLELALLNLVKNAIEATASSGGTVTLTSGVRDDRVLLIVSDSGSGIHPNALPTVFDDWFTTKGENGSGLGLGLVRQVVAELGGTTAIESTPNMGTTVTIDLPRLEEQA